MELVKEAASSLSNGLNKSLNNYRKEARRFSQSLKDLVDPEELIKSIHKATHPSEYETGEASVIHTPIEWPNQQMGEKKNIPRDKFQNAEEKVDKIHGENGFRDSKLLKKGKDCFKKKQRNCKEGNVYEK